MANSQYEKPAHLTTTQMATIITNQYEACAGSLAQGTLGPQLIGF